MNESNANWLKRNSHGMDNVFYRKIPLYLKASRDRWLIFFCFAFICSCRVDCSESCKLRKQMLENECKQLRRDMSSIEELKKSAEQQSRNYEQEVRLFTPLIGSYFMHYWDSRGACAPYRIKMFINLSVWKVICPNNEFIIRAYCFKFNNLWNWSVFSYENSKRSWDHAKLAKVLKF